MDELSRLHITIIGLGLMGGSLAAALHGQAAEIVGVDCDPATVAVAQARGYIDRGTDDPAEGVRAADVVILATPVRAILRLLPELGPRLPAGCLLMDLGSTKAQILAAMAELPSHVEPLGGHPMCGKESSGIDAADPMLYRDRTFILSPLARTSPAARALGEALVRAVGACPLVIDGARQDALVAALSHLPYLLACSLVSTADTLTAGDPLARRVAASGYRDTSRVAGSDVTMMADILMTNREEVVKATAVCIERLHNLMQWVEAGDEASLRAALAEIRTRRGEMLP